MRGCFLWPWLLVGPLLVVPLGCSKSHERRPPASDPLRLCYAPAAQERRVSSAARHRSHGTRCPSHVKGNAKKEPSRQQSS